MEFHQKFRPEKDMYHSYNFPVKDNSDAGEEYL